MSQAIHIQHVRLFDGSNVIADSSVIMQNGVIIAVGNDSIVPTDVQIIDGMGHTLLPGFIDAHTHVFGSALKEALIFGVTTELDMFTDYHMVAGIKQQEATGQALDMADLRSAGTAITAPGGHCTEYGIPIPTITAPEEAQSFVDARIAEGSDYIKIIYETRTSPIGSESGLVSDFEDGTTHTLFGSGWAISTDSVRGGRSTAQYTVVPEGANGGKGSLLVSGEVASGMPFAWAGVIFYPGTTPGQPANLSNKTGLSFWAKGDGRTYSIMIYSGSFMAMPGMVTFVAKPKWQEFSFTFSQFGTIDSHDVLGVSFTAGLIPGVFSFQIDDVRFTS